MKNALDLIRHAWLVIRMTDIGTAARETDATTAHRVAASVRAELARHRITQSDLGAKLHLSQTAISRRLSGDVPFNVNELAVVSKMTGVAFAKLVAGTERAA